MYNTVECNVLCSVLDHVQCSILFHTKLLCLESRAHICEKQKLASVPALLMEFHLCLRKLASLVIEGNTYMVEPKGCGALWVVYRETP